jgi:hypothetical protein
MKKKILSIFSPFIKDDEENREAYRHSLLSAHKLRNSIMKSEEMEYSETEKALHILLNELESVEHDYPEIYSEDCAMQMRDAILSGFILQKEGYVLPQRFGLHDDDGNQTLHLALTRYVERVSALAVGLNVTTPQERLEMFQDKNVVSFHQKRVDIFFRWIELER